MEESGQLNNALFHFAARPTIAPDKTNQVDVKYKGDNKVAQPKVKFQSGFLIYEKIKRQEKNKVERKEDKQHYVQREIIPPGIPEAVDLFMEESQ
jgi:hypothetical protein